MQAYADVAAMKAAMMSKMSGATDANTKLYDVKLWIVANGQWVEVSAEAFPKDGLTFVIPYPASTNGNDFNFTASHIFTKAMNGHTVGEIETAGTEKKNDGISVKVNGLSPVAISWNKIQNESGDNSNAASGNKNDISSSSNSNTQVTKEETKQTAKASVIPQTSDNSHPALLVVICLAAGLGLAITVLKKRKSDMK